MAAVSQRVTELYSTFWDKERWAEVVSNEACQLSSDRRAASRIIGELFQGMPSNICIEKLAPILHRRDIVNDEDLGYLVGCPQPPPPNYDTEKRHYFMLTLLKAAAIPSANCIKNLYLSLLDSFELSPCSKTQRHLSVAHYLRRKVQGSLSLASHCSYELDSEECRLQHCIKSLNDQCVPFDPVKASTLAQKLGTETEAQSYKEVCTQWIQGKGVTHCTVGDLVLALFESGLARLSCGLCPIYDSNQPDFIKRLHNLENLPTAFKEIAKFFCCEQEASIIERNFKDIPPTQILMLLRLIQLPNCGDKISSIIGYLFTCCNCKERQINYEAVTSKEVTSKDPQYPIQVPDVFSAAGQQDLRNLYQYSMHMMFMAHMQGVWNSGLHVQPHLSISSVPNPLALRDGSEQQHQYSVISQANGISDPVSASAVPDQACACSQSVPISCSDQVDPTADVSSTCDVSEQQNDTGVHRDGAEQSTDSQTANVTGTDTDDGDLQSYPTDAILQDQAQDFVDPFTLLEECCNGCWDVVNAMLLTQDNIHCLKIVLDAKDANGKTPLHHACMSGKYESVVLMIQKKADPSQVDHRGNCILHYSAVLRNEDLLLAVLTAFVHEGISTDIPTMDEKHTPLMIACTLHGPEVARAVELLLTHGASPDGHTMAFSRPIIVACEQDSLELMQLLVDYSADVNAQDKDSNTVLLKACLQKCWRIVKYLLGLKDININRSDRTGTTPLFAAVSADNQEITQLLLQKKARVNSVRAVSNEYITGHVEETPLAHACARGFLEIVQLLLMADADINFKCSDTVPAIGFAIICRQDHIVQYLLTHPRLDKSIGGLSSAIIISVKVGNAACTKLILNELGGAEKCLRLAEENDLPELQNHIHEYIVTSGPESGMQEKAPEPIEDFTVHSQGQARRFSQSSAVSMPLRFHHTQQRAKVEEVLLQFCEICVKAVTKTYSYSQWADITRELHPDLSSFFRRCANDNEDSQMLRSDFLGASTGMSPLSFLIEQKSLNTAIFQHGANSYFNNEPGEFYQRLIGAFHTIPGGEDLPWNIDGVLERLFSRQFSINVFSQRRGEFDHLPDRHDWRRSHMQPLPSVTGTCGSAEHLFPDWKPQPCSKPNQEEMRVQGDSERFEAEGRVESLASDTWTRSKETVREERVNTKILQTSEDTPRAAPIIQPNKNQHPRHLQRQHQERDNSGHEIHGANRMDNQGLKGTKQRQTEPRTSMGTHNGVQQQNPQAGSVATGASAHHQSPTLTGEGENRMEFSDSESVVIGKKSNEDIKESKRQQLNYYARSRGDNNEIDSLSSRLTTPLPEEDSQDETESLFRSASVLSYRDGNSNSRGIAGNSSSKCADWLETSLRPAQTKPITANSGCQLHRSQDSMQGKKTNSRSSKVQPSTSQSTNRKPVCITQDPSRPCGTNPIAKSHRNENKHGRVVARTSSSGCANWIDSDSGTSLRPARTKRTTVNSVGQLRRSQDSMQGKKTNSVSCQPSRSQSTVSLTQDQSRQCYHSSPTEDSETELSGPESLLTPQVVKRHPDVGTTSHLGHGVDLLNSHITNQQVHRSMAAHTNEDCERIVVDLPSCGGLAMFEHILSQIPTSHCQLVTFTITDAGTFSERCWHVTLKLPLARLTTLKKALFALYHRQQITKVIVSISYSSYTPPVLGPQSISDGHSESESVIVHLPQCNEVDFIELALSQPLHESHTSFNHKYAKILKIFFHKSNQSLSTDTVYVLPLYQLQTLRMVLLNQSESSGDDTAELHVQYSHI